MTDTEHNPPQSDPTADQFDDEWVAWAESVLAESAFDTSLGVEMGTDAQRLAAGDLSAETFYERYHEDVMEAFGRDDRPVTDGDPVPGGDQASGGPSPGVPSLEDDTSRRKLLGALGVVVAGAGFASAASNSVRGYASDDATGMATSDDEALGGTGGEGQFGMVIDTERCVACLQCSLACKEENDTDRGMHWVYVFRYEETRYGETDQEWLTRPCQHCSDPSCTYVCPTQARHKRWFDDGLVLTDYDLCVGCKYCMVACPYGVNFLGEAEPTDLSPGFQYETHGKNDRWVAGPAPEGVMAKCTFCVHRQDSGDPTLEGTTACEDICPADAIHFGDLNDPDSDPRRHLRRKPAAHTFGLLDEVGNEPNVIYIGKEPSKDAEPIPGPITYEDRGMEVLGEFDHDETGADAT
jgi:molybdopterin-containing oxidoreductase family iron-sulfur binding subunit